MSLSRSRVAPRARLALCAMLGFVAVAGCTPLRSHQGYVIDADLVNSVQPGVDNRQSVLQTLGKPSFAGQFDQGDWYYIARDSRNFAFRNPRAKSQITLQISFDKAGTVTGVRRGGVEQVVSINPSGDKTATLGRSRGFFQDLFGNIGSVGAPGATSGQQGNGGGGSGRTRP